MEDGIGKMVDFIEYIDPWLFCSYIRERSVDDIDLFRNFRVARIDDMKQKIGFGRIFQSG